MGAKEPPEPGYWSLSPDSLFFLKGTPDDCQYLSYAVVKSEKSLVFGGASPTSKGDTVEVITEVSKGTMKAELIGDAFGIPGGAEITFLEADDPLTKEECKRD